MSNQTQEKFKSFCFPEQQQIKIHETIDNKYQKSTLKTYRKCSFVMILLLYMWQLYKCDAIFKEVVFLTMWGYFFTFLYFSLVTLDAWLDRQDRFIHFSPNFKYVVETLYEASITLQVPITLVYWLLLHPFVVKDFPFWFVVRFDLEHTLPLVFLLFEFRMNVYRFNLRRLLLTFCFSILYLLFNMSNMQNNQVYSLLHEPIYPIVTWKDLASLINVIMSMTIAIGSFFLFRKIKTSQREKIRRKMEVKGE